jgi:hypothetical protein
MRNASNMNEKPRCTVCLHSQRRAIDELLAGGAASLRAIGRQFGVGRDALARHRERHILRAIKREILRKQHAADQTLAETWTTRLENTYQLAREGAARANADPEKWPVAVGFLHVMAKSAETGMRATGEIQTDRPMTINVDNIVVMPQIAAASVPIGTPDVIDVRALPESTEVQRSK